MYLGLSVLRALKVNTARLQAQSVCLVRLANTQITQKQNNAKIALMGNTDTNSLQNQHYAIPVQLANIQELRQKCAQTARQESFQLLQNKTRAKIVWLVNLQMKCLNRSAKIVLLDNLQIVKN